MAKPVQNHRIKDFSILANNFSNIRIAMTVRHLDDQTSSAHVVKFYTKKYST